MDTRASVAASKRKPAQKSEEVQKVEAPKKAKKKTGKKAATETIPRGKPKSGRPWKTEKEKFSKIVKTRGIRRSLEKKQVLRQDLKRVKAASRAVIAESKDAKEAKKQRRRDNIKRQKEIAHKSEVVQVISNPSKIKRMKKKQLRMIEKRDTLNMK